MQNQPNNLWGEPIFGYSRAQAIADGVLVDLTSATDDATACAIDGHPLISKNRTP